ncbi:hypothetical protein [Teredinibacter purpureus]|uniref:hypothetical protein n=1 Tax=Teredinibacter purpureus TaxID=2731756 RepID=UPI0005F84C24|nr:hypothetical protein [Teredinibacter purpureus]
MNISAENEIKLKVSPQEKIRVFLYQLFFSSFEMLALTLFIFARTFDLDIVQRIFLGGAVTVFSTVLYIFVKFRVSPLYFSTNVFFVFASAMLLVNVGGIGEFFLFLREIGMFLFIFVISAIWHVRRSNGVLDPIDPAPRYKFYSYGVLAVIFCSPFIAWFFKGNENLAGGLPFILIVIAEKALGYFQIKNK